jgi:hypothetical protein
VVRFVKTLKIKNMSTTGKVSFTDETDLELDHLEILGQMALDTIDIAGYNFVDPVILRSGDLIKNPPGHYYTGVWSLPKNMEFSQAEKCIRSMKMVVSNILYTGYSATVEELAYYEDLHKESLSTKIFATGEDLNDGLVNHVIYRSGKDSSGRMLEVEQREGVRDQGTTVLVVFRRVRR